MTALRLGRIVLVAMAVGAAIVLARRARAHATGRPVAGGVLMLSQRLELARG